MRSSPCPAASARSTRCSRCSPGASSACSKPCAFLDVDDFYDPLLAMIDRMVAERFLHPDQRADLWHGDDIDGLFAWLRDYKPAQASKWLDAKHRRELR